MITQGKWIFRDCPQKPRHLDFAVGNTTIACCEFLGQKPVREANAHLIAAAPDLLEACNALLKVCVCCHCTGWGFDTASNREKATARAKALLAVEKTKPCQMLSTDLMGGDKVGDLMNKIT